MISIDNLRTSLNTEFLGRQIKFMEETPSTNEDAWIFLKKILQKVLSSLQITR